MSVLGNLVKKANKHLTPTTRIFIEKSGSIYKVQTIENKTVFEGFNEKDTDLLLMGFCEALKLAKPLKKNKNGSN